MTGAEGSAPAEDRLAAELMATASETDSNGHPRHARESIQDALAALYFINAGGLAAEDPEGRRILSVFFRRHGINPLEPEEKVHEQVAAIMRERIDPALFRSFLTTVARTQDEIQAAVEMFGIDTARSTRAFLGNDVKNAPVEGQGIRGNARASGLDKQLFDRFAQARMGLQPGQPKSTRTAPIKGPKGKTPTKR